ncbi:MAG: GYF domain-containing protein [Verrucomicrobiota bacterium]|jgi:hypothetical protein
MYKVIGSDQQIYGPVTAGQLRQWLAEGRVNAATLAQTEGAADWKPLSSFPEFAIPPVVSMPPAPQVRDTESAHSLAVTALVCGILANFWCCGPLFGVLGIVFSTVALARLQRQSDAGDRAFAMAGLLLSIIGLIWQVLLPLFGIGGGWRFYRRHWRLR